MTAVPEYDLAYLRDYPKGSRYSHGLLFSTKLAENLQDQLKRVRIKKASLIIIDGTPGEGKTTLAVECADFLQGQHIDFGKQLAMGGEQLLTKLRVCMEEDLSVLIYDEAGDFSKRGALTKFNQRLIRVFETYRGLKIIIIVVLPDFSILDNALFRIKVPRMLLHCHDRQDFDYGNFDGYGLNEMFWILHHMKKSPNREFAFTVVEPNFVGHFLNIPTARSNELDSISTKSKKKTLVDQERQVAGMISYLDMEKAMGRSKDWVRREVKKRGIRPARVEKGVWYFHQQVLDDMLRESSARRKAYDKMTLRGAQ